MPYALSFGEHRQAGRGRAFKSADMRGDDDDYDLGEDYGYDDERERIERETIADFKDSRVHAVRFFMSQAHDALGTFGSDELEAAERNIASDPPDTVAAVARAFRVMETFGKVVPRNAIVAVLMEPISHIFETPPDPRFVFNERFVEKLRDAFLADHWMDAELPGLFAQFFRDDRRSMRNRMVHGSYVPSLDEARETVTIARRAYKRVHDLIGPPGFVADDSTLGF